MLTPGASEAARTLAEGRRSVAACFCQASRAQPSVPAPAAGLLPPTAGDALFYPAPAFGGSAAAGAGDGLGGALSILRDLPAIRAGLGVCPQFDVRWPQLSVGEHLELFAAIRGYARLAGVRVVVLANGHGCGWWFFRRCLYLKGWVA